MRNRNAIKGLLMAAVIAGTACLVFDNCSCGKKNRQKAVLEGHSKAFTAEPFEGITISAGENALDKDRKFKFREARPAEWKVAQKAVAVDGAVPFFVMDIDAGLKPDEVLPGLYDVAIDLKEMGVPKNLWNRVGVYRIVNEDQRYRYHSYVDRDGVLHYKANQNTLGCLVLTAGAGAWWLFKWYVTRKIIGKAGGIVVEWLVQKDVREYFKDRSDYMGVPWEDKNGNFLVHFRWRDMGGGKEAMERHLELEKAIFAQLDAIQEEADEEYERRIDAMATGRADLNWWEKWQNRKARDKARELLLRESVFQEYMQRDTLLKALQADPLSELPEPVLKIIDIIKTANAYLSGPAGLRPLPYQINVFMMNSTEMSDPGVNQKVPFGECYIKVGFEKGMVNGKWSDVPEHGQSVLLTLTHELFHSRQQSVYALWHMGMNAAESTAAVLEGDAARWYYRNGRKVTVDIDTKEGNNAIELTPRTKYYVYARPMDRMFATNRLTLEDFTSLEDLTSKVGTEWAAIGAETGYSLASLIETVRETAGKQNVGMVRFCENYIEGGDFSKLIKKSLDIDDEMLETGWNAFVKKYLGTICYAQLDVAMKDYQKLQTDCYQENLDLYENLSVYKISAGRLSDMGNQQWREWQNYYLKTWYLRPAPGLEKTFNAFVKPVGKAVDPHIRFYLSSSMFENGKEEPSLYCDQPGNKFLAMSVGNYDVPAKKADQEYWVVALPSPEAPVIRSVKNDKISITLPAVSKDLLKHKFVTGAILTLKDESGNVWTKDIAPRYFGKKVAWKLNGFSAPGKQFALSMHWYYNLDEETVYESPESEPAVWGGKEKPTAAVVDEGPEPEKNYWKQTAVRARQYSTSQDNKASDGKVVSRDFRSVTLVHDAGQKTCDFLGMSALEEDGNYVSAMHLDGTATYTEPPKFWRPRQRYKAAWEIAEDPYVLNMAEPYVFELRHGSTDPAACTQAGKEKRDMDRSTAGKMDWPRSVVTTFEARIPEYDGPKSFTFVQEFSVAEREGSDLKATVVLEYDYEWVGEEVEASEEDLGDLMVFVYFPLNARDQAYHGEHGGELQHNHSFSVVIPSGSYSLKKAGKGYVLEGRGQDVESGYKYDIQVRAELDKNKIPKNASFSLSGFKNTWDSSVGEDVHTYEARGTADLNRNEMGGSQREGTLTSFEGTIKTQKIGVFSYGNAEAKNSDGYEYGYVAIRWNL